MQKAHNTASHLSKSTQCSPAPTASLRLSRLEGGLKKPIEMRNGHVK
jgi:hypothetical protein